MPIRRITNIKEVPFVVKKFFNQAAEPATDEEHLWRERTARMVLDALGHCNLTAKPKRHNAAVRYARRWLNQEFADHPDPAQVDNAEATFDFAGLDEGFQQIREAVLDIQPFMFEGILENDDDTN